VKIGGIAKGVGIAAGVAGAVAGAGYAGQRVLARRLRARPDGQAARALDAPIYIDRRLDAFDGGSLYVVEAGEGPPIVLSHGVTNSIRTWVHQLETLPYYNTFWNTSTPSQIELVRKSRRAVARTN